MQPRTDAPLVFVSHPMAGVHRIPATWLDGYAPSGFRLASAAQIRRWHDERGLAPPADAEREAAAQLLAWQAAAPSGLAA